MLWCTATTVFSDRQRRWVLRWRFLSSSPLTSNRPPPMSPIFPNPEIYENPLKYISHTPRRRKIRDRIYPISHRIDYESLSQWRWNNRFFLKFGSDHNSTTSLIQTFIISRSSSSMTGIELMALFGWVCNRGLHGGVVVGIDERRCLVV